MVLILERQMTRDYFAFLSWRTPKIYFFLRLRLRRDGTTTICTAAYSTVQYSTVQYSTPVFVKYSADMRSDAGWRLYIKCTKKIVLSRASFSWMQSSVICDSGFFLEMPSNQTWKSLVIQPEALLTVVQDSLALFIPLHQSQKLPRLVPVSPAVSPRVETLLTAVQGTLAELIPRHGSRRLPRLVPVSPAVSRPRQLC